MGIFKDVFSDLATIFLKPDKALNFSFNQLPEDDQAPGLTLETSDIVDNLVVVRLKSSQKKKSKGKILSCRFSKRLERKISRVLMPLPITIKLIRPGKQ